MFKLNSKRNMKIENYSHYLKKIEPGQYVLHNHYRKKLHLGMSINAMVGLWAVPTEFWAEHL